MSADAQSGQKQRVMAPEDEVVVTHEDIDRAHDRARVSEARLGRGLRARLMLPAPHYRGGERDQHHAGDQQAEPK